MSRLSITGRLFSCLICLVALSACAVGPDYQRPDMQLQADYANAPAGHWLAADSLSPDPAGQWWLVFNDPGLEQLMARMLLANLDLLEAEARYRIAVAELESSRSGLFPSLGADTSLTRSAQGPSTAGNPSNSYAAGLSTNWEIDLWGRVRRSIEASQASKDASAADLAGLKLSLQSTLAQAWFGLQASLLQQDLLERTVREYEHALQLTRNQFAAGMVSPADVAAATSQLEQAKAQGIRNRWQAKQQQHAIMVLLGTSPGAYELPPAAGLAQVPAVPVAVPSTLLVRRPDIAAAERRLAEANARIGVAQAAWFPELNLSAQTGYRASELADWLSAPARFWSLGPALALSIFDGGARSAALDSARANYDVLAASYRKTVLEAIREVEDALVQADALVAEQDARDKAEVAANESLRLVSNQYRAGMLDYLNVVQAQTNALNARQTVIDVQQQRLSAAVLLITAQGG